MKASNKSPKIGKRRYRMSCWYTTRITCHVYGIEAHRNGAWINCSIGNIPVMHTEKSVVKKWMRWLRDPEGTRSEWGGDDKDVPTETIMASIKDVFSSLATRH